MPGKTRSSERGAAAVVVAITLLVLMGMAAIAIDLGAAWNERRQDQTAADLAVIAGTLSYASPTALVAEVKDTANANVVANVTDADWVACADPDRPAGYIPFTIGGSTYQCISANPSFVRVRLPRQYTEATFGKVIGFDELTTYAVAEATILPPGGTGLLPFAVRNGSGAGELCLDTGTGSQITPPCDGNESGSFGNMAPPLFGNPFLGTTPDCGNQTASEGYVAEAIAMGVDHIIFKFTSAEWAATGWNPADNTSNSTVRNNSNMDFCTDIGAPVAAAADGIPINSVVIDTGNSMKTATTKGLITGTNFADGDDARLTRSTNTRQFGTSTVYNVDNTPLWTFLGNATGPGGHGLAYCDRATIMSLAALDAKNLAMANCMKTYDTNGATAQIFSDAIMTSPRFGVAPYLWHTNLGSGVSYRPVQKFAIVYVGGMRLNDGSGPGTATVFYPDDTNNSKITPKKTNWVIDQVGGYLIDDNMVSDEVLAFYPGFDENALQPSLTK